MAAKPRPSEKAKSPGIFGHEQSEQILFRTGRSPRFPPENQQSKMFVYPLLQLLQFGAPGGDPQNRFAIVQTSQPEYDFRVQSIHLRHGILNRLG